MKLGALIRGYENFKYSSMAAPQNFTQYEHDQEHLLSIFFRICDSIIRQSKQSLFLVVNLNFDPLVEPLIQLLHSSSISTILITHIGRFVDILVPYHPHNIMFFLDNLEESLSLILNSASKQNHNDIGQKRGKFSEPFDYPTNLTKFRERESRKSLRYCVKMENQLKSREAAKCDENMSVTHNELEGLSTLTDQNFNLTKGLHANHIWNSNNHIIFILRNTRNEPHTTSSILQLHQQSATHEPHNSTRNNCTPSYEDEMLIFSFRFFWRFFRGYKTIVCLERGCARYDPFKERIIWFDAKDEEFFDFTVNDMNGKSAYIVQDLSQIDEGVQDKYFHNVMAEALLAIFKQLEISMNYTPTYIGQVLENQLKPMDLSQFKTGLEFGADIHLTEPFFYGDEANFDKFDQTVGVETRAMCVIAPHSEFMPQVFVGFKTFKPLVWIFIIITILIFFVAQYVFQCSQCRIFRHYYSEEAVILYENTSPFLIVYSYFICGSPPTLLLGRFFTGKMIFLIFSFSALIISTVFLGGMTTLLADPVRYPEIDTLQDLEASDLFIQVPDHIVARETFTKLGKSEALKTKLINTLQSYNYLVSLYLFKEYDLMNSMNYANEIALGGADNVSTICQNLKAMIEVDAFVIEVPDIIHKDAKSREWITNVAFSFHFVEECFSKSPYSFSFFKNMFLNHQFQQHVTHFLEFGLMKKILTSSMSHQAIVIENIPRNREPKPFSLNDLQPAFMSLVVGLFLSYLVFIGEIVAEHYKEMTTSAPPGNKAANEGWENYKVAPRGDIPRRNLIAPMSCPQNNMDPSNKNHLYARRSRWSLSDLDRAG
ncbi:unnamed protein product [Bemisia tabaci]|uniref:Ionotropic receptor n=1 Tax=Bemisia tabaci TaxID=7038 RepID=A0A9P0F574_BEMTA|nr:unnamed protein product [Bemisia tabaci]